MKKQIIKISATTLSLMVILTPVVFAIENPLKGGTSISEFISSIMKYVVRVGGIVAVFMFILTGFNFVKAQGNPGEIDKAKGMFYGTVIGVAVLLGAQLIASLIVGTIKSIT